jgi:hypothetical protein
MPNQTTTLFAVFPDVASAESAKQELLSHGFDQHDIQFTSTGSFTSNAGSGNSALTGTVDSTAPSTGGALGGGLRSMFSVNNEESGYYMDVLQRGDTAITVKTDEAQVDRAIDILNQHGAINVDEEPRADSERVTKEK